MQELVQTMHLLHLFRHRSFVENLKLFTFVQLFLHGRLANLRKVWIEDVRHIGTVKIVSHFLVKQL